MKIVIVNRHVEDFLGGSEMQCDNIASELSKRGHAVTYVAPAGRNEHDYARSYSIISVASNYKEIVRATLKCQPDVVYWRFNKNYLLGFARAMARARVPIVFAVSHINDTNKLNYLANPRVSLKEMLRTIKQIATSFINYQGFRYISTVTYLNQDYLGSLSVQHESFVPNSVSHETVPFHWDRPYVVWVANIKRAKRPELFLELARRLQGMGVDFLMIGAMLSTSYAWIADQEEVAEFKYLGPKSIAEVNGIIQQSLMLVHTCEPEGFGNNFIQAWLSGKPTVSLGFDPGGYIEKQGLGGVAHDDMDQFVEIVDDLIRNQAKRELIGAHAREFANAHFSIRTTVDGVEAAIKTAVDASSTFEPSA